MQKTRDYLLGVNYDYYNYICISHFGDFQYFNDHFVYHVLYVYQVVIAISILVII